MRQSHQKSRSRGRNRKPQNPLSRNYESNGPDVKIRGNAGHIAEKYSSLARDALSNGDTVMAENYLQHAEHYNRLIAAAQAQRAEEQAQQQAAGRGPQPDVEGSDDASANSREGNSESGSQATSSESGEETAKGQKGGRPRRNRRVQADSQEQGGDDEAASGTEASHQNGKSDGADVEAQSKGGESETSAEAESISDDAASLPDSITGGLRAEEA